MVVVPGGNERAGVSLGVDSTYSPIGVAGTRGLAIPGLCSDRPCCMPDTVASSRWQKALL